MDTKKKINKKPGMRYPRKSYKEKGFCMGSICLSSK
jgi:hypothetical protein